MATFYIDDATGSDANSTADAQSASTPWKTIEKFFATADVATGSIAEVTPGTYTPAGGYLNITTNANDKTLVVRRKTGATGVVTVNFENALGVYFNTTITAGDYTFQDLTIANPTADGYAVRFRCASAGSTAACRLVNVTATSAIDCIYTDAITGNGKKLYISGSTLTSTSGIGITPRSLDVFSVTDNSTINGSVLFYGTCGDATIENSAIVSRSLAVRCSTDVTLLDSLTIRTSHLSTNSATAAHSVVQILQNVTAITVTDSTMTHTGEATSAMGFHVGTDGVVAAEGIGTVTFVRNRVTIPVSHAVLIGAGANSGTYTDNVVVSNGDIGFVVKGNLNTLTRNRCIGKQPLLIKNGSENDIQYNTFYSTSGSAGRWEAASAVLPDDNTIKNNILVVADLSGTAYVWQDVDGADYTNIVDYNLYYTPRDVFGLKLATTYATFALWVAAWTGSEADNDNNSVLGNPQFVSINPASSDFLRLRNGSPGIGIGEGGTTVGAVSDVMNGRGDRITRVTNRLALR